MPVTAATNQPACMHSSAISGDELKKIQNKAATIAHQLKAISVANQAERKKLASEHSNLSQSQSQVEMMEHGQSIRQQLLNLANRQKKLLQCFRTEKEVNKKLNTLCQQQKQQQQQQKQASLQSTTQLQETSNREQAEDTAELLKHKAVSAAISNLLQHLRPADECQVVHTTELQPERFVLAPPNIIQLQHSQSVSSSGNPPNPGMGDMFSTSTQLLPQWSSGNSNCKLHSDAKQINLQHSQISFSAKKYTQTPSTTALTEANKLITPATHQRPMPSQFHLPTEPHTALHVQPSQPRAPTTLAQPVPLETLIHHHFLEPGQDCLHCVIMVINC